MSSSFLFLCRTMPGEGAEGVTHIDETCYCCTFEVVEVYWIDCLHAVFLDVLNDLHEEDVFDDLNRLLLRLAFAWFCGCVC